MIRIAFFVVAALTGCHPSPPACSDTSIPRAPSPLPANYDFTPLAKKWCSQLASCGHGSSDCEQVYLAAVQMAMTAMTQPSPPPASARAVPTSSATASRVFTCVDSEEARADPTICPGSLPTGACTGSPVDLTTPAASPMPDGTVGVNKCETLCGDCPVGNGDVGCENIADPSGCAQLCQFEGACGYSYWYATCDASQDWCYHYCRCLGINNGLYDPNGCGIWTDPFQCKP